MRNPMKLIAALSGWMFACAQASQNGEMDVVPVDDSRSADVHAMDVSTTADAHGTDAPGADAAGTDAPGTDAMAMAEARTPSDAPSEAAADSGIQPTPFGSIVPLYTDPTDSSWTVIASAAQSHPTVRVVAIINPNSGPTASADQSYATGIPMLQSSGVHVIAYVATGYASRPPGDVQHDIDLYHSQYPSLEGIFFDEAAVYEAGHETLYMQYAQYARSAGLSFVVANPGTAPMSQYIPLFDVTMVYETGGEADPASLAMWACQPHSVGAFAYGIPTLDPAYVTSVRTDVNWIYLTNDTLPNPYDTLPPYFSDLLTALGS